MDVMRIAGISIFGASAALVLRRIRPELSAALSLCAGVLLTLLVIPFIARIINGVTTMAQAGGVDSEYMTQLLKVAGISLLADFAAQTCRDAGEEGLALKTELAGRVLLLSLALPAMQGLLAQIFSLAS